MPCSAHAYGAPRASLEDECCVCVGLRLAEADRRKCASSHHLLRRCKAVAPATEERKQYDDKLSSDYSVSMKEDREAAQWFTAQYLQGRMVDTHVASL